MDGTLWDGVAAYAQGFNDYFVTSHMERRLTKNDLYRFMGMEEAQYLEAVLPEFSPAVRKEAYKQIIEFQYKRIHTDGGMLYEGVIEGLAKLAERYKLFIVSNCPELTIGHFMKWAGIESLITETMSHGMNFRPKHENIQLLLKKYALQQPVYVGDTDSDRRQSDLVPIPFVYVGYGFGKAQNYALRFDSFNQLVGYFTTAILDK